MDGINGITEAYALAMLIPILLLDVSGSKFQVLQFIEPSYLIVAIIGLLVFSIFNFRPKGKAKCFAGDVGSLGVAFILLFLIGSKVMQTGDITYLIFLVVYGVDGVLTICHRIMLHENLGQAHRKHAYQLMANELKMSHITVSLLYACLQLAISLVFIYLVPNTILAHWTFFLGSIIVLSVGYVMFKKKYYHLHEEYLRGLEPK
jgi:UDP-N-acetylmuramyl pentapeptide phosphotransferase/UDP-N-acetylglucosamine-1-phosphate transferase